MRAADRDGVFKLLGEREESCIPADSVKKAKLAYEMTHDMMQYLEAFNGRR